MKHHNTRFRDPEVVMINTMDSLADAYKFSAPYHDPEDVDKKLSVFKTLDMPFNGMKSYIFQMTTSMLFRDLLFCIRPVSSIWARSQRTVPFNEDNLFLSSEISDNPSLVKFSTDLIDLAYDGMSKGKSLDEVKKYLPVATSTQFTISIDDRTLMTFLKMLHDRNEELFNVYRLAILNAIGEDIDYLLNRNIGDIYDNLAIDYDNEPLGTDRLGNTVMSFVSIPYNIAAQFIRQHYSHVKSELFNLMDKYDINTLYKMDSNDRIVVGVYADVHSYERLMSNRSTWFAQFDKEEGSWSEIVGSYVKDMSPEEFFKFIRAKNGDDPYLKGQISRIDGIDVAPPSPLLLEFPKMVEWRKDIYGSDSVVFKKWEELVDAGLINDNPDNEYRIRYLDTLKKLGVTHPKDLINIDRKEAHN